MSSNFLFLDRDFPILAKLGCAAERYLFTDTDACLYKLGKIGEVIVNEMMQLDEIVEPTVDNTHANRIRLMWKIGMLPKDIDNILFSLRKARNITAHTNEDNFADCKVLLEMTYNLSIWFMETYGDWSFVPVKFVLPDDPRNLPDYKKLAEEQEREIERLQKAKQPITISSAIPTEQRVKRATDVAGRMKLSEAETRYLIDADLRKVGWEVDTNMLRYSKGTLPKKGRNLAIAEWPTDSTVGNFGKVDYALFVGLQLVAVIEAKANDVDISSVIDYQCKDYAKAIKPEHKEYQIGTWNEYKTPFVFATNGRHYLKQLETKSGIWFLDLRSADSIPKAFHGWMSPQGIVEMLAQDLDMANCKLKATSYDLLRDKSGLSLRDYQIDAIQAAEEAIVGGKSTALLAMATGTGKTRTAIGLIYRMLSSKRFKRILFLVDRNTLGEQAQGNFKDYKIEDLKTLFQIYDIKELGDTAFEPETKVQVATVQSMVKRILYNDGDTMPAVSDYDLIIVDEAHRGYILDKEMGEDELLYRNQLDFVSKYCAVITYFDAVKIALTATPALHTSQIFGKPVFDYPYRKAVIEGYLVDHDTPHQIGTEQNQNGITFHKGETQAIYNLVTGELTNSDELQDEMTFEVDEFNRKVITEPFNRTVLTEIASDIDPEEKTQGKTLIYAVDDQHADLIVKILKEIYGARGVSNNAIMKITGKVGGGNPQKVQEAINRYKNEQFPSIAVTVDLLTTGVDVPEITTLVFLRKVKSRILFEQMLGRATRLCPKIKKTHFEIYDAVGVYNSLYDYSTMKPVVVDASATFDDLLAGLKVFDSDEKSSYQIDLILAKLQRQKRNMSQEATEQFEDLTGGLNPSQLIEVISKLPVADARTKLLNSQKLFEMLDKGGLNNPRLVIISDKEDKLLFHTRGYGEGVQPADYLDEFAAFVRGNINQIAALNIVCTRPKDLTRATLKSLKLELDREGYTEQRLNTALKETTNENIVADIISIIRRYAIGSTLLSHEQRIARAIQRLKNAHNFNRQEENWISKIEKYLLNESVLNVDSFDEGAFKNDGGFLMINKKFNNQLKDIVQELNEYLYDDGGHVA